MALHDSYIARGCQLSLCELRREIEEEGEANNFKGGDSLLRSKLTPWPDKISLKDDFMVSPWIMVYFFPSKGMTAFHPM